MEETTTLQSVYDHLHAAWRDLPRELNKLRDDLGAILDDVGEALADRLNPQSVDNIRRHATTEHLARCLLERFIDDLPVNEDGHLYDMLNSLSISEILNSGAETPRALFEWLNGRKNVREH